MGVALEGEGLKVWEGLRNTEGLKLHSNKAHNSEFPNLNQKNPQTLNSEFLVRKVSSNQFTFLNEFIVVFTMERWKKMLILAG